MTAPDATPASTPRSVDGSPAPAAHAEWVRSRLEYVTGPRGNIALVGYEPLEEAPVEIPGLGATARHVRGEAGAWVTPTEPGLAWDGVELTGETFVEALRADGSSVLRRGSVSADVFSLDGSDYEVRVYDAHSDRFDAFGGIGVYPYDPALVLQGRFLPFEESRSVPWGFTRSSDTGHTKQVPGSLAVTVAGREYELLAFSDSGGLVLVFADATTGVESYAPGRFLKLPMPGPDGVVEVDLNRTIVPPCGFSDFYSCPIPPPENRIEAPVRAGEQRSVWRDGAH